MSFEKGYILHIIGRKKQVFFKFLFKVLLHHRHSRFDVRHGLNFLKGVMLVHAKLLRVSVLKNNLQIINNTLSYHA